MILILYNLALLLGLILSAPWWLWRMATTQKYREGLRERLGFVPARFRTRSDTRPVVWVHAVSVGEVLAVSRLVVELDAALAGYQLLISTTTRTGQALARQRFGSARVFYCPLDLFWAVGAWLNALHPELLILAETEFWPNLLSACFRRGIPVAVVNARISDRSWPRYRRLQGLWQGFLSRLSLVLAQTPVDAERLLALGCRAKRLSVAGNLKFDVRAAGEADATRMLRVLAPGEPFLVAGSTLEGEETAVLDAHRAIVAAGQPLITVLAPRHPERFDYVAARLDASGIPWVRRSAWNSKQAGSVGSLPAGHIVLLDTIGELASVYSLASVAFVGGSLVPAGGHNPLEPAQFGVAILMGPNYANFRAIADDLLIARAMRIVRKEELAGVIAELLVELESGGGAARAMGDRARAVFEQQSGATARCVGAIASLLGSGVTETTAAMQAERGA